MKHLAVICICVGLAILTSENAWANEKPERDGFTLELGFGFGFWQIARTGEDAVLQVLHEQYSVGIGYFISHSTAILLRASQPSVIALYNDSDDPVYHFFVGANVQHWIHDRIYLGGGIGFAENLDDGEGVGLNFRAGFSFAQWKNHSLRIGFEVYARLMNGYTTWGEIVSVEWQWF